jgi:hypothetical protein
MSKLSFVSILGALVITAAASRPAAAQQWFYNGGHAREVHYVLERVSGWQLPSCATCDDLKAPDIPVNPNSTQRDAQVGAAAVYAFGAEAYAKVGKTAEAEQAAEMVHRSLEQANSLCSDSPSVEARGMTPATLRIWPCPAPFTLD